MNLTKVIIIIILLLSGCQNQTYQDKEGYIEINNKKIYIDIADDFSSRYMGLSGRDNLCPDCGMLFVFKDRGEKTFVMRDMNFPLDIIWIKDKKIVKIDKNLPPDNDENLEKYNSQSKVDFVLEVNGNFSLENKIRNL
jgi:uncharacterized membrane protein (UPF0127 family)